MDLSNLLGLVYGNSPLLVEGGRAVLIFLWFPLQGQFPSQLLLFGIFQGIRNTAATCLLFLLSTAIQDLRFW